MVQVQDSGTSVFLWILRNLRNTLFYSTPLLGTSVLSMVIKVVHQIF